MFIPGQTGHVAEHNAIAGVSFLASRYASIQVAIDAADAGGGGRVLVPPGTHTIATGLTVPEGVHLCGSGSQSCVIRASASMSKLVSVESNTVVSDLLLDGNSLATNVYYAPFTARSILERVRVRNGTNGVVFDQTQNARAFNVMSEGCLRNYVFVNAAANIFMFGCDADQSSEDAAARNVLVTEDLTGTNGWTTSAAFNSGTRQIRFFGGIFERLGTDYCVEVRKGSATFVGSELNGGSSGSSIAYVATAADSGAVAAATFRDCRFSLGGGKASTVGMGGVAKVRDCDYTGSGGQTESQMHVASGGTVSIS